MEIYRTLTLLAVFTAAGCTAPNKKLTSWHSPIDDFAHTVKETVLPEKPQPATQIVAACANRLQQLPDPYHNGRMTTGLVGQVFLYPADMHQFMPFELTGELTVMVTDMPTTLREPHKPEVWHFANKTVQKMMVDDDRYGHSLVVFAPWPPEWRDVTQVMVQVRYDQPEQEAPLCCKDMLVAIDLTPQGGPGGSGIRAATSEVPNPLAAVSAMKTTSQRTPWVSASAVNATTIKADMISGDWKPVPTPPPIVKDAPTTAAPINGQPMTVPNTTAVQPGLAAPGPEFQRTVIRR